MPPNDSHAARLSVNRLPIELLQEIILLAAAPWDQRTTLRLSRVSRIWRTAVLGLPYLFTEADWYGWPVSRVEWWCERAGARPLTIRLYPRFNTVPWADNAVIARYAPQCGVFQLKPDDWLSRTVLHETTRALLTAQAPALRHLEISSSESTFISDTLDIYIDSDNMPNLCVLRTRGVIPHISKPLAGVTEMEYFITGLKAWDAWTKALTKLPNLKHLNLSFNPDDYGFHEGLRTALPSLEILVLSGIHYHNMSNVRSFFACAELPKLRLISLFNIGCKDACRGTIELLVRIISRIGPAMLIARPGTLCTGVKAAYSFRIQQTLSIKPCPASPQRFTHTSSTGRSPPIVSCELHAS